MKPALAAAFTGAVILAGGVLLAGDFASRIGQSNPVPAAPRTAAGSLMASSLERSPGPTRTAFLQTVNLKVENMWCASCPIIVRRALERVDGVSKARVSFRSKTATVAFDPARCDVAKLIAASAAYGFPSSVIR